MKFNLEDIWAAEEFLSKFNAAKLTAIEFYYKGTRVEPEVDTTEWRGSNSTFVDYEFVKEWQDWSIRNSQIENNILMNDND